MIANPPKAAGLGLRARPRASHIVVVALVAAIAACGGPAPPPDGSTADGQQTPAGIDRSGDGSSARPAAAAALPSLVDGLELQVLAVAVPDALDAPGGDELRAMLDAIDLSPSDISHEIAYDPAGRLAIGRWVLPDRDAASILDAWDQAAGAGWRATTVAAEPALTGSAPDGDDAWAVARDGIFLFVVADDPALAEAGITATQ